MKEEKTIQQLLEMLDHPEAYTEQEIRDIINQDEETRETHRLMVEAKRSSRHTHANNLTNVDAAWKRFNQRRKMQKQRFSWMKIAASFIIVPVPVNLPMTKVTGLCLPCGQTASCDAFRIRLFA